VSQKEVIKMRIPKQDAIATGLVAVAVVIFLFWLTDMADIGTRAAGMVILGLGFAASAVAVVPGFDQLVRGNKTYLGITSLLGLVALVAGVQMLLSSSGAGLTVLTATMVALWAIATTHHLWLAKARQGATQVCPECGNDAQLAVCDVCGYEIVEIARTKASPRSM
jgi:hypothetical protein